MYNMRYSLFGHSSRDSDQPRNNRNKRTRYVQQKYFFYLFVSFLNAIFVFSDLWTLQLCEPLWRRQSGDDDITEVITLDADSDSDTDTESVRRRPKSIQKSDSVVTIPDDATPSTSRQSTQKDSQSEATSSEYEKTLSAVTNFFVEDLHTISTVKDSGFKKFVNFLKPDLVLPTQDDILNQILLLYGIERANLLLLLGSIEAISIAAERWTSFTDTTYATIKANFINAEWEPQSYVLATVELGDTNSFGLLNDKILEVIKNWEIENKVVSTVYDWYRPPAEFLSPGQYAQLGKKMCCFALKLQTAIDTCFNSIPEIKTLIDKCKQLVAYFLHNNVAEIYLHKYQNYLELSADQLIQATPDEINSTYLMLDRLLSQKLAVVSVLRDTGIY